MTKIKFGHKVKDLVSGFEGIYTASVKYMNGCKKMAIDGKVIDNKTESIWVDRSQVVYIDEGIRYKVEGILKKTKVEEPGGPTKVNPIRESKP